MVSGKPPADPLFASDVADVHASTNQLQRDYIHLGRMITDQDHTTGPKKERTCLISTLQNKSQGTCSQRIGFGSLADKHPIALHIIAFHS